MDLKFLPIGTVCLVENVNKKQMIIGYSKSGYDYVAVEYPKGFDSDNKLSYFNHNQVYELYSLGYKNEESRIFNGTLTSVQGVHQDDEENDSMTEIKIDKIEEVSSNIEDIPTISSAIKFDENGVVIADGTEEAVPQEKETSVSQIKFDENGVVIADGTEELNKDNTTVFNAPIKFDENGVVISDGTEEAVPQEKETLVSQIKFDENGVVIADGTEEKSEEQNLVEISKQIPVVNDDTTVDVSDVVKQINEIENSEESSEESEGTSETPKKEKRGLFHFGRK